MITGRPAVVRRGKADAELLGEHPVDPPARPLDKPHSFEGVGKQWAAQVRRRDEQVVYAYARWETTQGLISSWSSLHWACTAPGRV